MLSLGYFSQPKKLSLQAQDAEAHGAFLKVIELMGPQRSSLDHIEAVQLCGQICSRFVSPTIVNSAFMRIAEAFKNGPITLQMEVLKIVQRNSKSLRKIHNYTEFIRPIFTVMHSNDPISRAVTLRLLAEIAVSIPDQLDVHHAIRMALQSSNHTELAAALFACNSLAKVSASFADTVAADVLALLDNNDFSIDEKIAVMHILPHVTSFRVDPEYVISVVDGMLRFPTGEAYSSRLVEACICTIGLLVARYPTEHLIRAHVDRLANWIVDERVEISSLASHELVRLFDRCAVHIPGQLAVETVIRFVNSRNPRQSRTGVLCGEKFLMNQLADYSHFVQDGVLADLFSSLIHAKGALQAAILNVICRVYSLYCERTVMEDHKSAQDFGLRLSEALNAVADVYCSSRNPKVLRLLLSAVHPDNLRCFSSDVTQKCMTVLRNIEPSSAAEMVLLLRFARDCLINGIQPARELVRFWMAQVDSRQLTSSWTGYELAFLSLGVKFLQSTSESGLDANWVKGIAKTFQLDSWDVYRLARATLADGRYSVARSLLNSLLDDPNMTKGSLSYSWIVLLRNLAESELAESSIIFCADGSIDLSKSSVGSSRSSQILLDVQTKLGTLRRPGRCGLFMKSYLDIRMRFRFDLELLVLALEKIRRACSESSLSDNFTSICSQHLSLPLQKLQALCVEIDQLHSIMFDADGPALAVVGFLGQVCQSLCVGLNNLQGRSSDRNVSSKTDVNQATHIMDALAGISGSGPVEGDVTSQYQLLSETFRAGMLALKFPVPTPRYFMQQFQQTNLTVSLTPPINSDKDYIAVLNMGTKFTLKVEGIVTSESKSTAPIRSVRATRSIVRWKLAKSLPYSSKALTYLEVSPSVMEHTSSMKDLNFFCHTFVIGLGRPGIYRLTLEFEFEDSNGRFWSALSPMSCAVKITESSLKR